VFTGARIRADENAAFAPLEGAFVRDSSRAGQ